MGVVCETWEEEIFSASSKFILLVSSPKFVSSPKRLPEGFLNQAKISTIQSSFLPLAVMVKETSFRTSVLHAFTQRVMSVVAWAMKLDFEDTAMLSAL